MASVVGGLSQLAPTTGTTTGQQVQTPGWSGPGQFNLASISDVQTTVSGDTVGGSGQSSTSGFDTVGGAGQGSGFDTVSGPNQGSGGFAGQPQGGGTEQVAATQTQDGGNTTLNLPDGSTITIVGTTQVDSSFFH
jgi:hypothetical protein